MRIAINTRFLLKDKLEGIGWFTYEIATRLVAQRPQDEFLFFFDRPYDESFVFADNVQAIVLSPPARHPILFYVWFESSVTNALEKYKADIFISPDNFCSLRTSVPTILVIHDLAYEHFPEQLRKRDLWYYSYFMPRFIQKADHIITVSEYTKSDLLDKHSISAEKISVACNGCRPTFQAMHADKQEKIRAQYSDSKDYFFYIGAVHPRKNVHRLIAAFDQFKEATQSNLKLLIAGRFSWQTGKVKEAYDTALYQTDIHFLGYVDDEILPQLMGSAFALTYVSTFEGFGVPLLEAMHCEIPIITSGISSMPEVVEEAALLVDPFQVHSIAEAMKLCYEKKELRQQLVEKGKVQRTKFSWEKATEIVSDAIERFNTKM